MFFFQAEDGIRDVAVTGVQTCALPISTSDLRSSLIGVRQAFSRLTLTMRSAAALALASASLGSLTLRRPRIARAWEIGRASCRERVLISVVAVSLKKKEEYMGESVCHI